MRSSQKQVQKKEFCYSLLSRPCHLACGVSSWLHTRAYASPLTQEVTDDGNGKKPLDRLNASCRDKIIMLVLRMQGTSAQHKASAVRRARERRHSPHPCHISKNEGEAGKLNT